jgi:hypothetical protein
MRHLAPKPSNSGGKIDATQWHWVAVTGAAFKSGNSDFSWWTDSGSDNDKNLLNLFVLGEDGVVRWGLSG